MNSGPYDTDRNRQRFIRLGCDEETVEALLEGLVWPETGGNNAKCCVGFVTAALHHGVADIDEQLKAVGADPDLA